MLVIWKNCLEKLQLNFLINPVQRKKRRYLFHAIGGSWYVEKLGQKLPPVKKSKVRKNPKRG